MNVALPPVSYNSTELAARITPDHIYNWMAFKAYGKEDPDQHDRPKLRANSMRYWKKGLSYFFKTTQKWNEESQTGNPTQSSKVIDLIKAV